jgi:hypothetical protein
VSVKDTPKLLTELLRVIALQEEAPRGFRVPARFRSSSTSRTARTLPTASRARSRRARSKRALAEHETRPLAAAVGGREQEDACARHRLSVSGRSSGGSGWSRVVPSSVQGMGGVERQPDRLAGPPRVVDRGDQLRLPRGPATWPTRDPVPEGIHSDRDRIRYRGPRRCAAAASLTPTPSTGSGRGSPGNASRPAGEDVRVDGAQDLGRQAVEADIGGAVAGGPSVTGLRSHGTRRSRASVRRATGPAGPGDRPASPSTGRGGSRRGRSSSRCDAPRGVGRTV